jgi:hypothetical protein
MTKFASSFNRKVQPPREEMNNHIKQLEKLSTQSDRIRYLIKEFPDAKDREISDFLELNRPQWVHNVRNYKPKRK